MQPLAPSETQADWVALMLREFSRSQATGFMLAVAKGALFGAGLGVLLALVACWVFARLGWFDFQIRFARGLRWTLYALITLLTGLFLSVAGFWSGALRGAERVLSQSQLATDAFPQIAGVIADGMMWVQAHAEHPGDTNQIARGVDLFRQGERALNAAQFPAQFEQLREETVTGLVTRLEQTALERTPHLQGGLTEKLFHQFLHSLGRAAVEKKASSEMKRWGADHVYVTIRRGLLAEAGKAGNPETIHRPELVAFLVRDGIVPGILKPIRTAARAQQLPLLFLAGLVLVGPPVCIRLFRRRPDRQSPPGPAPAAPPAME